MSNQLSPLGSIPLDADLLEALIEEHESITLPRLLRLWCYFRNELAEPNGEGGSAGCPAQAAGLPERFMIHSDPEETSPREIVIENDIGWRIHTLVDFMFPEMPKLTSKARNPRKRETIEALLNAVFMANGGTSLWQDAALLGSVYGSVDFLVNTERLATLAPGAVPSNLADADPHTSDLVNRIGSMLAIETVEAPRAIPLVNQSDYRRLDAYIIHYEQLIHDVERAGWLTKLSRAIRSSSHGTSRRASVTVTEVISATHWQRYEDGVLVMDRVNRLGRLPIVHVQNLSQPLTYHGLSDVEPLIPLQDELNTRLSDRANRVTMQSFRMWLGKGIDDFTDHPVGPGQMWVTDNLDASIEPFGGDADSPSEKAHIEELREALDKTSGVTPAAAGHIKARVGNLTSENALRISLMGTIAKTKRKRVTYGAGITQLCELILHALDVYGIFRTEPNDREVEIVWADPIAADETRRIEDALAKAQLGVPLHVLRAELGYADEQTARLEPAENATT